MSCNFVLLWTLKLKVIYSLIQCDRTPELSENDTGSLSNWKKTEYVPSVKSKPLERITRLVINVSYISSEIRIGVK